MTDEINNNSDITLPDDLDNEVKMRFDLLPEDVQNVITESNYPLTLFEIAKANKLTYEQLETLQLETLMALLGMNKPDEYRSFLQNQFKRNDAEMDVLIQAVNERIFDPIKESMHKIYSDNDSDDAIIESGGNQIPISTEAPQVSADNYFSNAVNESQISEPAPTIIPIKTAPVISQTQPVYQQPQSTFVPPQPVIAPVISQSMPAAPVSAPIPTPTPMPVSAPAPIQSPTIVANKLSMSATLMPNKTTDYTLPRTTPQSTNPVAPQTPPQAGDQYREKI